MLGYMAAYFLESRLIGNSINEIQHFRNNLTLISPVRPKGFSQPVEKMNIQLPTNISIIDKS